MTQRNDHFGSKNQRSDDMLSEIHARLQERIGVRPDLAITDTKAVDRDSVYALVSYASNMPTPTTSELTEFIARSFGGKVIPLYEDAKAFPDQNAVLLPLAKYRQVRPIEDVASMVSVMADARYLDTELRTVWDVVSDDQGNKVLKRVTEDNISQIAADRVQRMTTTAGTQRFNANMALASVKGSGTSMTEVGDKVRCFFEGQIYSDCLVKARLDGGKNFDVQIPSVGKVTVSREAIVAIQETSKKSADQTKKTLNDYYRKVYGDKYAKNLTQSYGDDDKDSKKESHWPAVRSK